MQELDVQVVSSINQIDPNTWDAFHQSRPFSSHAWYQFGENVLAQETPYYILLSKHGELVARATFWALRHEPLPVQSKGVRAVMATVFERFPLFICRTPLTDISGLVLPDDPALRPEALTTIASVARRLSRQVGASFTAFDYLCADEISAEGFPMLGMSEPSTHFVNRWDSFEAYVSQLGASAKKDYHRHTNRAKDMGIVVEAHDRITHLDRALELIRGVETHHKTAPNPHIRRVLEHVHRVDFTWLTAELDGRLVGCGLLIGDGSAHILTALGLDYEVKYAYFQLMYAALRRVIERGGRELRGGGGAYEFKQRLGFEPVNNTQIALASKNTALAHFVRRLAG